MRIPPRSTLTTAHHTAAMEQRIRTGGKPKRVFVPSSATFPTLVVAMMCPIADVRKAALPPPHLFARVSTIGLASYRASADSPLHRDSRTGLATAKFITLVNSSRSKNNARFGACPAPWTCHQANMRTPNIRIVGIKTRVPYCPQELATKAPSPDTCRANTATLLAMFTFAKKAVSRSVDAASTVRFATSSARWKDSKTDVVAPSAL